MGHGHVSRRGRRLLSGPNATPVAVVTGAAGGIGATIAVRSARDGFDVAITDLLTAEETVRLVEANGPAHSAHQCDLADPDAVERF